MVAEGAQNDRTAGADDGAAVTSAGTTPEAVDPKVAAAVAAAEAAGPQSGETVRVDSWIWSVRLVKTRSMGAAAGACRGQQPAESVETEAVDLLGRHAAPHLMGGL
ncbi:hypothetical protein AB0K70_25815, partial [Streptomyces werraensis]